LRNKLRHREEQKALDLPLRVVHSGGWSLAVGAEIRFDVIDGTLHKLLLKIETKKGSKAVHPAPPTTPMAYLIRL
jgi:hypothetical protein